MSHYVVIKDGLVTGGPFELFNDENRSPNSHWGLEQMKLNGFLPADLSHNPQVEEIDFNNPIVTDDLVVYARKPLSASKIKENEDAVVDYQRKTEYPSMEETLEAVYESLAFGDDTKLQAIVTKRSQVDTKYPKT